MRLERIKRLPEARQRDVIARLLKRTLAHALANGEPVAGAVVARMKREQSTTVDVSRNWVSVDLDALDLRVVHRVAFDLLAYDEARGPRAMRWERLDTHERTVRLEEARWWALECERLAGVGIAALDLIEVNL